MEEHHIDQLLQGFANIISDARSDFEKFIEQKTEEIKNKMTDLEHAIESLKDEPE